MTRRLKSEELANSRRASDRGTGGESDTVYQRNHDF